MNFFLGNRRYGTRSHMLVTCVPLSNFSIAERRLFTTAGRDARVEARIIFKIDVRACV